MPKKKTHLFTNKILGVSAGFHDAAAAVVSGGRILYAGHAERYSRVKNDPLLNRALLRTATEGTDPITIAYYENPYLKWLRMLFAGQKPKFISSETIAREHFRYYAPNLKNYPHHLSHAAAGFQTSTFTSAIVVVVDAIGEWDTATIWHASYSPLGRVQYKRLWGLRYPHSLGLFYSAMTQRAGLKPNEDEYILMGMAAYGKSVHRFNSRFFDGLKSTVNWHAGADVVDGLEGMDPYDLAAEAQHTIELKLSKVFAIAEQFAAQYRTYNLVYMGGVALNCSANSKVIDSRFWEGVWIMPNPGDAGSALGAAALAYGYQLEWDGPYLGTDIEGEYPVAELLDHLLTHQIAGVAAGPAEYGPRALGNRSLLADPRGPDIKDRVNEIKQRQKFRPFAPAILEEHAADYFDMSRVPGGQSPYMQFTVPCKDPVAFPAIAHYDGTSRVQTVGKDCQSGLRQLLEQWYQATGCPMLLNTSLNIKGQPMVDTVEDALRFEEHYGVRVFVGR